MLLALTLGLVPWFARLEAQESLTIGWAELDTRGLDADLSRLGVLIPQALMKATSFIDERSMSYLEALTHTSKAINVEMEKARDAVAQSRRKRDLVSISVRDPAQRATELRTAQLALDKSIAALEELLLRQSSLVDTPLGSGIPLTLWKGHETGTLLPADGVPALICAENKLGMLVFGKLESLGPYLSVDLVLYRAATDEEVWKTAEYTALDDIDGLLASLERPLATALAGRPFGRVFFETDPNESEILINGSPYLASKTLFYSHGSYQASVSAPGYHTVATRFAIIPGSDTMVRVQLEPIRAASVLVESMPSGASLYLDGLSVGNTPIELRGASYPRILTAKKEGFDDQKVVLRPGFENGRLVLDLQASDGLAYTDRYEQAKGSFYQSLGWFILSLPLTVLSYGTFNAYMRLAPLPSSVSEDTANTLTLYYYGSQTVFWVSAAASASLATNTLVRLVRYIKAAR